MFSIIVPILDPFDRLVSAGAIQSALNKVLALEGKFELILVNNNSVTSSPELTRYLRTWAESYPGKVKIVEPNTNLGTARGFNAGLRVSNPNSKYLVFMSTDADIVDPAMLMKIKKEFDHNPNLGIGHPISVFEDMNAFNLHRYNYKAFLALLNKDSKSGTGDLSFSEKQYALDVVSARSGISAPFPCTPLTFAIHRREMIDEIGSFDEGVEFGCYEVVDLGLRALYGGYQVARLNGIFVNHRRLCIRNLIVGGTDESRRLPHSDIMIQSSDWWFKKWGRPYNEIFAEWRWGAPLFLMMMPFFWLKRAGRRFKKTVHRYRGLLP